MLASLLKPEMAEETSVRIIDVFVAMRHFIIENKDIYKSLRNINNTLVDYNNKINYLLIKFAKKEQLLLLLIIMLILKDWI